MAKVKLSRAGGYDPKKGPSHPDNHDPTLELASAPPCCPHSVERHAYNGCAECGCCVLWTEHTDRLFDMSPAGIVANAGRLVRIARAAVRWRNADATNAPDAFRAYDALRAAVDEAVRK